MLHRVAESRAAIEAAAARQVARGPSAANARCVLPIDTTVCACHLHSEGLLGLVPASPWPFRRSGFSSWRLCIRQRERANSSTRRAGGARIASGSHCKDGRYGSQVCHCLLQQLLVKYASRDIYRQREQRVCVRAAVCELHTAYLPLEPRVH